MKDVEIPVDEVNLEFLEDFLLSDRVSEDAMTLSELDGFLAGIAVGPSRSSRRNGCRSSGAARASPTSRTKRRWPPCSARSSASTTTS